MVFFTRARGGLRWFCAGCREPRRADSGPALVVAPDRNRAFRPPVHPLTFPQYADPAAILDTIRERPVKGPGGWPSRRGVAAPRPMGLLLISPRRPQHRARSRGAHPPRLGFRVVIAGLVRARVWRGSPAGGKRGGAGRLSVSSRAPRRLVSFQVGGERELCDRTLAVVRGLRVRRAARAAGEPPNDLNEDQAVEQSPADRDRRAPCPLVRFPLCKSEPGATPREGHNYCSDPFGLLGVGPMAALGDGVRHAPPFATPQL